MLIKITSSPNFCFEKNGGGGGGGGGGGHLVKNIIFHLTELNRKTLSNKKAITNLQSEFDSVLLWLEFKNTIFGILLENVKVLPHFFLM